MSSYVGVLVSDPWLQSQFTQVELRTLKSKVYLDRILFDSGVSLHYLCVESFHFFLYILVCFEQNSIRTFHCRRFTTCFRKVESF
jgi:hypothetical protein